MQQREAAIGLEMKIYSRKFVTPGRSRTHNNRHISPSSAKPGLTDVLVRPAGLADPAENRRGNLKLRLIYI
ncbi:MAG: hypothetical protein ACYSR9_07310 [Planctomycetota bacterium]